MKKGIRPAVIAMSVVLFSCNTPEPDSQKPADENEQSRATNLEGDIREEVGRRRETKPEEENREEAIRTKPLPSSLPEHVTVIREDGDGFSVGEMPLLLDTYNRKGRRAGTGITVDHRNSILDLSKLENGQWLPLGLQVGGASLASVRAVVPKVVVTSDGLVYELEKKTMAATGPFVSLKLYDKKRKKVDPKSVGITVMQGDSVLQHEISDNLIVISGVEKEPIRLTLSTDQDKQEFVLYPYLRGAEARLVGINVYKVKIGKLIETSH